MTPYEKWLKTTWYVQARPEFSIRETWGLWKSFNALTDYTIKDVLSTGALATIWGASIVVSKPGKGK